MFYGYQVDGIYTSEQDVLSYKTADGKTILPYAVADEASLNPQSWVGRYKIRDVNGDGKIGAEDRTIIGNPHPDFTGGVNLSVGWKGFPYVGSEEFASDVNPKVSNMDESGNYIYIWDKVAEDLQFAYDNLPDIWASDKGRVNKWAAAFLAKLRLYQSSPYNGTNGSSDHWADAKALLEAIIANGQDNNGTKFKLADTYEDLFTAGSADWSGESGFDIQRTISGSQVITNSIEGSWHTAPSGGMGTSGFRGFYRSSSGYQYRSF